MEKNQSAVDVGRLPLQLSNNAGGDGLALSISAGEPNFDPYTRFPRWQRWFIVFIVAYCGFLSPISSTAVLSAVPEIASEYGTTGSVVNASNALYLTFMGISPLAFGPCAATFGRRPPAVVTSILFVAFSVGTALAPNLSAFFAFRILTAFAGTGFLILGSCAVGDIYEPTQRATAMSWFLCGALVGPAVGPFLGGVIVTFRNWRIIFWLQAALGGAAVVLILFGFPETAHSKKMDELCTFPTRKEKVKKMLEWFNPSGVLGLARMPNLIFLGLATGALLWNMYSLVTPIRYILNPRFSLETPLQASFFYLAPGGGYILGSLFGGRWADYTVKKWITRRGERVPEDRLRSALPFMALAIPGSMLVYGWSVQTETGGVVVPVIAMFLQGVAQLVALPSLNTYCIDVIPGRSSEVIAGNYMARYFCGAIGSAVVLPATENIGVGWFSTISAGFLVFASGGLYVTILYGQGWRENEAARRLSEVR